MRFLFRLVVLALAAVGAKALYDQFAPKATELRGPASDVFDSAKDATRGITQHAKDAASEVADDARQRAGSVRDQATDAVQQVQDDTPTVANSASASSS